jgi:integrase
VSLGKLNTERVVPLDPPTLDALDAWMSVCGQQRALPHPRDGRPTDFLFVLGGQRVGVPAGRRSAHPHAVRSSKNNRRSLAARW